MIQNQVRIYQDRISSSPMVQEEYKNITRDYQTAQAFYDDLLKKMNQSKMATDLERRQQGEQFSVMDQPNLPEGPTFPKRGVFVGAGFAGWSDSGHHAGGLERISRHAAAQRARCMGLYQSFPRLA